MLNQAISKFWSVSFWAIVQNPILSMIIKILFWAVAIYLGYLAYKMFFKKD